jgi:heat shock protein HslJ
MKKTMMALGLALVSSVATATPDFALLDNTQWKKTGVDASNQFTLTLQVSVEDQNVLQIGGVGGCNRYFGSLTLVDSQLTVGGIGSTLMYCGPLQKPENEFFSALYKTVDLELVGNQLILLKEDQNGELVESLVFDAVQ